MTNFFNSRHEELIADDGERHEEIERDKDVDDDGPVLSLFLGEEIPGEIVYGWGSAVRPWNTKQHGSVIAMVILKLRLVHDDKSEGVTLTD